MPVPASARVVAFRPGGSLTRLENAVAFHGMAQEKRRPYWR
jgi:hypothetical protein